jgi:hypothetical protein
VVENEIEGKKERTIVKKDEIEIHFERHWYYPRHRLLTLKNGSEGWKKTQENNEKNRVAQRIEMVSINRKPKMQLQNQVAIENISAN